MSKKKKNKKKNIGVRNKDTFDYTKISNDKSYYKVNDDIHKKKKNRIIAISFILILSLSLFVLFLFNKNIIYPEFQLKGNKEITLDFGDKYEEEGYFVKIFNKDVSKNVVVKNNVDYTKLGDYTIDYILRINYLNIDRVLKRKIKIVDKESPIINVDSNDEVYIKQYNNYYIPNYIAVDNYDGDITSKVSVENTVNTDVPGEYIVSFNVSDSSNNNTYKEIKVIVEENKSKNSYVTISISNQTVDYYEYGNLVLHSDVVTGRNGDTPLGTYSVVGKATDTVLTGDDYRVNVSYWIGFIGNSIGMHDASWRSSFGGDIYTYDPSHGCVNMPYSKIESLYYMIDYGTPVYVVE